MAYSTSSYSFTDDEVTQLARCTDQAEFLYLIKRFLQSKSIDLSAVADAQTTLDTSIDYGGSVLARFFEAQTHALHLEVGYALFESLSRVGRGHLSLTRACSYISYPHGRGITFYGMGLFMFRLYLSLLVS